MSGRGRGAPRAALAALAAALTFCAACADPPPALPTAPPISAAGSPLVYVALGASETAGVGLNDQALQVRYAWPQLFFNEALPRAAQYYNFAVPATTTADALRDQVPRALSVHPDVATVFFHVDDLVRGVDPVSFGINLDSIVRQLRQGGRTRVLVANAPRIDTLPALLACEGAPSATAKCPLPAGTTIPPLSAIDTAVNAYNAAIAAVVSREGARLVDLNAHSDLLTSHPEYLSVDGFHPSALGDQLIAQLFADAYRM